MKFTRVGIVKIAIVLILLVNVYGAIPGLYYAPYRGIGPEWVAVYEENGDVRNPPVSVRKWDARGNLSDTGRQVQVTIRNTYSESRTNFIARITLGILALGAITFVTLKK